MDYAEKLKELLTTTAKQNASDLHIAVGRRPTIRVDGVLVALQKESITTPEMAEGIISGLLTVELKERLLKRKTDSKSEIEKRLCLAKDEMKARREYDCVIINRSLTEAVCRLDRFLSVT